MPAADATSPQGLPALYREHHGWLYGWLRRRLGSACDAADLAHDTYVRILVSGRAPCAGDSRRYLTRIAQGLAIDLYRRRQIEAAYLRTLTLMASREAPSEEARALVIEALVELDGLLRRLPPKVRRALLLCKLDGRSYGEIAAELRVSVSSVEKYVAAALRACYEVRYGSRG